MKTCEDVLAFPRHGFAAFRDPLLPRESDRAQGCLPLWEMVGKKHRSCDVSPDFAFPLPPETGAVPGDSDANRGYLSLEIACRSSAIPRFRWASVGITGIPSRCSSPATSIKIPSRLATSIMLRTKTTGRPSSTNLADQVKLAEPSAWHRPPPRPGRGRVFPASALPVPRR